MTEHLKPWYCIRFCQKLGDSQVETIRKIQRFFSDNAMGITQIQEWYNRFRGGRMSVVNDAYSGRPSTSWNDKLIDQVRTLAMQDCRVTVRELAEEVGISTGSVHSILTDDLAMRRVSVKFMLKLLTMEQKQLCLEVLQDMLDSANHDPEFLNIVTTGDESWVYGYDPETKVQSSQWKYSTSPRPKKARQVWSNVKVMLTIFFDSRVVVCHKYTPQGQNINKEYYLEFLNRLCDAVQRKSPDLWTAGMWKLHHNNAPAHSSQLIQTLLAKHNIPMVWQVPYFPDMAPWDFWLFLHLKTQLKGTRIWVMRWHYMEHNGQAVLHSQRGIPEMLRTVAEPLGEMFSNKETTSKAIRVAVLQACKCIFPGHRLDTFWTGHVRYRYCIFSLLNHLLRFRLKCQNPLL